MKEMVLFSRSGIWNGKKFMNVSDEFKDIQMK